jgi:NRAMP (natural resistance-associated macrophage protein)-like metal ion transporter
VSADEPKRRARGGLLGWLKVLGPGLISGAADNDPSGIATYSQTGAQFGYGQLWTALYQTPLLIAVQEACGRIGAVTGKGLAGVIKQYYPRPVLLGVVLLVVVANSINIGADIGAVAASAKLVVDVPFALLAVLTAAVVLGLEVFLTYQTYARGLKWLTLALLAYPATALLTPEPWGKILAATFVPHIEFSFAFLFIIVGVLGTTISPYLFFWQASEEVEEELQHHIPSDSKGRPKLPQGYVRDIRIDTAIGMIASSLAQWFIIMTTGTVLFAHGVNNIATAADAAKALEPLVRSFHNSGQVAKDLFAVGVVGLGLLAIPVMAGSSSYAISEAMGWNEGLSRKLKDARGFYGVIIISTLVGLMLNFVGVDPIKALVLAAVFNGVASVPLLFVIGRINGSTNILGANRGGALSRTLLWLTFAVMAAASLALAYALVFKP